jgi:hypothetical protein
MLDLRRKQPAVATLNLYLSVRETRTPNVIHHTQQRPLGHGGPSAGG